MYGKMGGKGACSAESGGFFTQQRNYPTTQLRDNFNSLQEPLSMSTVSTMISTQDTQDGDGRPVIDSKIDLHCA